MPSHLLKKLLILISIVLNFLAIFGYFYGLLPSRYYSVGWLTIISIAMLWLIQNWYPLGLRLGLYINIFLSFVAFVPVFGWIAIVYGLKLCTDDIMHLIDIFDDRMTPDQPSTSNQTKFEYSTKDVIDVEVVE